MWPEIDKHYNSWNINLSGKNPKGGTGFLMNSNKRNKKRKKRRKRK